MSLFTITVDGTLYCNKIQYNSYHTVCICIMPKVIFSHLTTVAKLTGIFQVEKLNYIYTNSKSLPIKQLIQNKGRKPKQNFNSVECNLQVNIVEQNLATLRGQFPSTITNAKKQKLWETITSQINSYQKRTPIEIREKWQNMSQIDKNKFWDNAVP